MTPPPSSRLRIVAPVPRWQQIADHLRAQILSGRYPAGQPLPSEEALAAEFGVSRPTVRQGIATLTTEGLVTVRRPYGTIVRDPHARPGLIERRGLTDTPDGFTEPGPPAYTDIGEPVYLRLDATVAQADLLDIEPGQPMATREVLQQTGDGGPRRAVRLSVPFSVAADLHTPWRRDGRLPTPTDLYTWLAHHGHRPTFTEHIRARMPVGDETHALHVAGGVPLLVITRLTHTPQRPVALEEIRMPADQTELAYPLPLTHTRKTTKPAGSRTSATGRTR